MRWLLFGTAIWVAAWAAIGMAQTRAGMPPNTVEDALHEMTDAAGVIFAGQVVEVRRTSESVVEVEFRVDRAVRGCAAGGPYVLREWAGLWVGVARYRVGQRLMMLLRSPGASGMSSPVGGMDGVIPIRGVQSDLAGATAVGAAAAAPLESAVEMVDLRWVGARMQRAAGVRADVLVSGASVGGVAASSSLPSSVAAQAASVDSVVEMMTGWSKVAR